MFETGPLRFIRMNLDKKAACVWIRDISAATVIKKKKKKKSSAASFFCATLIQCVCSSPPPPPKSLSGAPPFPSHISSLSFCCGPLCAADLQSQHPPSPPPLFVWNCYANVETAASFFIYFPLRLASYRLGWRWREGGVVGGARGGRPIARPLRLQIKSDLSICSICLFFSPHCNS